MFWDASESNGEEGFFSTCPVSCGGVAPAAAVLNLPLDAKPLIEALVSSDCVVLFNGAMTATEVVTGEIALLFICDAPVVTLLVTWVLPKTPVFKVAVSTPVGGLAIASGFC